MGSPLKGEPPRQLFSSPIREKGGFPGSSYLFWFYGISEFVGYLMPNPFCTNKQSYFKQFSLA